MVSAAVTMVFYFECSDPRYIIYMGRDKYENEHLIANGWPEDLWFHVDNHSSAHVYLRLPKGDTFDTVPDDIVHECSQLTKANSIEGSKLANVRIVYTPWANLKKTVGMADGQVGYHDQANKKFHTVEHRTNAIVNRLEKTKVEKHNDHNELVRLRRQRDAEEEEEIRRQRELGKVERKQEDKAAITAAWLKQMEIEESRSLMDYVGPEPSVDEPTEKLAKPSGKKGKKGKYDGRASVDDSMIDDLFGLSAVSASQSAAGGDDPAGGGWMDDDDEDFWGGGGAAEDVSDPYGMSRDTVGPARRRDKELGALGAEVEKVEASRKSVDEMQDLAKLAHERKAAMKVKAAEAAKKKAEADAVEAAALAARRTALDGKRAEAAATVARASDAARARLAADVASGALEGHLEANAAVHEEELMVVEAIFGEEAFERDEDASPPAYILTVAGDDDNGVSVRIRVSYVAEYPSHLPPELKLVDGVALADTQFVSDALQALFFDERDASLAADEPAEGVMPKWSEWIKEEWIATMGAP